MMEFGACIDVGDEVDIDVTVRYTAVAATRGYREPPYGVPMEPDEPAHPEDIEVVRDDSGEDVTDDLTQEQLDRLTEQAGNHMSDAADDAKTEAAVDRYLDSLDPDYPY